jgi:hypothetical protein
MLKMADKSKNHALSGAATRENGALFNRLLEPGPAMP